MKYNTISFSSICEELHDWLFKNQSKKVIDDNCLIAENLISAIINSGKAYSHDRIKDWEKWERGLVDISYDQFKQELFGDLHIPDTETMRIVIDSCYHNKEAFEIKYIDFYEFVNFHWDNFDESDLLEPFDHVFLFPDLKILVVLHHEGSYYKVFC